MQEFGPWTERRRRELKLSEEGFAHYAVLARSYYGRIERGEQNVSTQPGLDRGALGNVRAELTRGLTEDVCLAFVEGEKRRPTRIEAMLRGSASSLIGASLRP